MIPKKEYLLSLIIPVCLYCLTGCISLIYAADVTLTIGDGSGDPGSQNNPVPVNLINRDNEVGGMQLDICDEGNYLTCTACATAERSAGFVCAVQEQESGCCGIVLVGVGDTISAGEGPLFTLTYDSVPQAPGDACKRLDAQEVQIRDDSEQLLDVTSAPGEFCFSGPSIASLTDPLKKPQALLWPALMVVRGERTHFQWFRTRLSYEPSNVVLPLLPLPLVLSENTMWDLVLVMPVAMAGVEDQIVTLTVTTGDEVVVGNFWVRSNTL